MSNNNTCSANKGKSIEEFFNATMLTGKQAVRPARLFLLENMIIPNASIVWPDECLRPIF
jgi:hypothetical protein